MDPLTYTTPGTYTVTWVYKDSCGNVSNQTQQVIVKDTIAPVIGNITANPQELWPPNHKMVDVTVNYNVADNCTSLPNITCTLSVTSNEPINGTGDGDTAPDWVVVDSHHVQLRSERAGNRTGRIYTITVTSADGVSNSSSQAVTVTVPHDQRQT